MTESNSISVRAEQKQGLLAVIEQTEQPRRQRPFSVAQTKHFWCILLLFLIVGVISVVYVSSHKSNQEDKTVIQKQGKSPNWDWEKNYAVNDENPQKNSRFQSTSNNDYNNNGNKGKRPSQMESSARQRAEPPENIGHMNIYINKPVENDNRRSLQRFRFPVARYNRRRFPLIGPFFNFMPWIPIFADRFTRQTIIYSSAGVYILPPLINNYGTLYSVAELVASGYASLVSTGIQPTGSVDMRSFFQSTPIIGPGIPTINHLAGGFIGGIRTNFGSFTILKDPEQVNNKYRSSSYSHKNRHRQRSRDSGSSIKKPPSIHNRMTTSTAASGGNPTRSASEVHRTLIIDTIYPYSTSRKPIISANYSFPGPLLEAYEGDTFVIRVINRLDTPSTIHWHGMRQFGSPDMDGAVGVTQCAIPPNYEMIYKFKAEPAGTTWYHGHLLEQYTDGLYGPLIIRQRNEPNHELYDSERVLLIADWYNNRAHSELLPWYLNPNNPDGNEPSPDAIVVNGKFTQSLFIQLSGSTRVRFRVINAASFSMYNVSIDGLPLHIIEVDTTSTFPYKVNTFAINVAQRVSFYIDLSELDPSYMATGTSATTSLFIRIQAIVSMYPVDIVNYIPPYEPQRYPYPTFFNPLYLAILSLDSTNSTPTYPANQDTPILSNAVTPIETNLLDARPFDRNSKGIPEPTHNLYLVIVFDLGTDGINHPYLNNVTYSSDANYMHMRPDPTEGITSDTYAPLLYQMIEKPNHLRIPSPRIENGNQLPTIQSDQNGHYLVPYKAVVDIFLNNTDGGEHPFHLHGHNFWIISTSDYSEAESLYAGDYIQRDTVSIPALGWVKIRFVADNPGAWFFHCHIEWHMSAGLALAFLVSPQQLLANGNTVSQSQKDLCQALRQFNVKQGTKSY